MRPARQLLRPAIKLRVRKRARRPTFANKTSLGLFPEWHHLEGRPLRAAGPSNLSVTYAPAGASLSALGSYLRFPIWPNGGGQAPVIPPFHPDVRLLVADAALAAKFAR